MQNRSSDFYGLPVWMWVLAALAVLSIVFDFDPIGTTLEEYYGPVGRRIVIVGIIVAGIVWVRLRERRRGK